MRTTVSSQVRVGLYADFEIMIIRCELMNDFHCRRKCASPNTLSIQVPVFSNLGQSLPNLNQMNTTITNPPSNMLLAPPKGVPPRGTSYPPPSPPLRRSPALTFNRNPPLLKTRHISSGSQASSVTISCDIDYCSNTGKRRKLGI